METGYDILFFWVARMILMTTYHVGQIPFKTVYLHGLVRDAQNRKMSKSLGNIINPQDMIDKYGTDALRFALVFNTAPGTDMALAEDKIKGMKHYGNKLWNICRYILMNLDTLEEQPFEAKTIADKIILEQLQKLVTDTAIHLDSFRIHEAAQALYQFSWYELADEYLEKSKPQLLDPALKANTQAMLLHCLTTILKLHHPFMPFLTEAVWSHLEQDKPLLIAKWPK
jgi:valyl-tRNA synthetase